MFPSNPPNPTAWLLLHLLCLHFPKPPTDLRPLLRASELPRLHGNHTDPHAPSVLDKKPQVTVSEQFKSTLTPY